jgi:hypothetical protein
MLIVTNRPPTRALEIASPSIWTDIDAALERTLAARE